MVEAKLPVMDRCPHCPGIHNVVPPDGQRNQYDLVFIGEAPGKQENEAVRPFIGKTGQEVNDHYLPLAGLSRRSVYMTNAIKCLPPGPQGKLQMGRPRDMELLESCASCHLYPELMETKPRLIVPMGAFACRAIDPDISLDMQHGIPLETSWGTVFPMYHPAGGIHEPKKMLLIRNDWARLSKYLKGKLPTPVDSIPHNYSVITADELLSDYLDVINTSYPIACDTEITRHYEPWCLTYSTAPGIARMIMADDKDAVEIFGQMILRWTGPVLFHNWLFDRKVTRDMGIVIPDKSVVDTMVMSYHLGNLPQGLKALCYRLLGMRMRDFDDLVTPYSTPLCLSYLHKAYQMDWPKPEEQLVRDADGAWKLYKPQSVGSKIKRFLTDYGKNPNLDVFDRWAQWEDSHAQIEDACGPWPGKDIRYAPLDEAIDYACADASGLLQLYPVLKRMVRDVRRKPNEYWGLQ